jgi:hypothetical protein
VQKEGIIELMIVKNHSFDPGTRKRIDKTLPIRNSQENKKINPVIRKSL